jgi:hypothetical protein
MVYHMATKLPRLQITLDLDVYAALKTHRDLTGEPAATVIRGWLRECLPGLVALNEALQAARGGKEKAAAALSSFVESQVREARQVQMDLRRRPGRPRKLSGRAR